MATVSTRAPATIDPSHVGGHYADTATSISDASGTKNDLARGMRLYGNIRGSSRFSGSEDTAKMMQERVRKTIEDMEDLSIYDESLDSRLAAWTTGDPKGALAAYRAYEELMKERELFRMALHGAFNGAPRNSSGDGPMSDTTEIGSLAPPGFTEYPSEEPFSNDDEFNGAMVPRTVKTQEEIEDEIATGINKEGIPTYLLQDLRMTGKTAHPKAMTDTALTSLSSDERTIVPFTEEEVRQMQSIADGLNQIQVPTRTAISTDDPRTREIVNGLNQIQVSTRTGISTDDPRVRDIVNGLNGIQVPPQYTRGSRSGATTQGLGNAMSRIGKMWESIVSQMNRERSEVIQWKEANPLGGADEFGAAEEEDENGEVKTQVQYHNGRLKNGGSFQSFSYTSKSRGQGLPSASALSHTMRGAQEAH
ncbi:hypothetical protein I302_106587 [Kwoniella bestiolae CBS 10118]|uniref:Uncharacterized protein n=1 Tax=Kwoniella bestiolae CBS 10118 TaxID=1296100 RepID=A0A1B9G104_9TREE|nr:hypothetical protein I302_06151 [Kwoniella bestiolae CBS 10118]OCF24690.1 hypothetical protein I302_06151 [Kwoniella bestiolae CBS 10118]